MIIPVFIPFWITAALVIGIIGVILLYCENLLPPWITVIYKFGKTLFSLNARERSIYSTRIMGWMMIPKRYFSHFYFGAVVIHMIISVSIFYAESKTRYYAAPFLKVIFGEIKYDGVPRYFFFLLCLIHVTRRFLECVLVYVRSAAKINIIHYLTGITFYLSIAMFNANNCLDSSVMSIDRPWEYSIAVFLFFISQCWQLHTHIILSNLRRNPEAQVNYRCNIIIRQFLLRFYRIINITPKSDANLSTVAPPIRRAGYFLPNDCEFELISCPNYTAELVIYTALYVLTNYNYNFAALYIWVIVNQIVSAKLTHKWYQEVFRDDYPPHRRAIIPFIL